MEFVCVKWVVVVCWSTLSDGGWGDYGMSVSNGGCLVVSEENVSVCI